MCGIVGEIVFDGTRPDIETIRKVNAALSSRGPDASGMVEIDHLVLAHRRLSIIDLSEAAAQPMHDAELGLVLVFNGCIYNYRELRAELQGLGYNFFSTSDTEVIIKAHHAWGRQAPKRLNGMFAYALYDRVSRKTYLVRDRFGIKPLYYTLTNYRLRFASTLPALLAGGGVDTAIDRTGLCHYMSLHGAIPAPVTLLRGVRKLAPGTLCCVHPDGRLESESYWSISYSRDTVDESLSADEWIERLTPALTAAVHRQVVADVDIGVFLSGGLDSSLMVALLANAAPGRLSTFSIGFTASGPQEGDEFVYSDLIARTFGTNHDQIFIDSDDVITSLPDTIRAMSEPMMSRDCIGFYKLSQHAAQHLKVVQAGQGADELFGGYGFYANFLRTADAPAQYAETIFDYPQAKLAEALAPAWLGEAFASQAYVRLAMDAFDAPDPLDKVLYFHSCVKMPEDQLKRVDDMSMAWGLETRVPFLDHEFAELVARIPARFKIMEGGKGLLKRLARRYLPGEVIDRPKGYFPVPEIQYPQGKILEYARDALTSRAARERGLFNQAYLNSLFESPTRAHTRSGAAELWYCATLELWLQIHNL